MLKALTTYVMTAFLLMSYSLNAKIQGKVDIGAACINVDILESGKTVDTLYMKGVRGEATINVYSGWFLKPGFLLAGVHGKLEACNIGIGHFYPVTEKLLLMPSVGAGWSYLRTSINLGGKEFTEKFHSTTPYVALEFCYKLTSCWTLMGMYQYGWSKTRTTIEPILRAKSHSEGPNYALGFDYSINPNWSITGGVGYNITLSHEKHGLRAKGAKLGIAYFF
ncbi:MAG: outer membrane beta-barrel protein [Parachlamydiaceae bacterium]|nr:outer membrane beta-barrel protein [Parachlamydiaceae bacterium]